MNTLNSNIYDNLELLPLDMQGWNGNSNVFKKLIDEIKPKTIIEVGSWKGLSSINMATHIKHNNLNCKIYCVDTWLGALEFWDDLNDTPERNLLLKNGYPQIYYQFLSNVIHNKVEDYIIPFPTTSTIGSKYFLKNNIKSDLIYIDASHDEEDVYTDLINYYKIINKEGILFGDDYNAWIGVKTAVEKFTKNFGLNFEILEDNFWLIKC